LRSKKARPNDTSLAREGTKESGTAIEATAASMIGLAT
jgi:hypothetical protein